MKTAYIYSEKFGSFFYGADHPMRPERLKLTHELISATGLDNLPDAGYLEARRATEEELLLFHTRDYLRSLKDSNMGVTPPEGTAHGLGYGDNPVFKGVFDWSCLYAGATLQAAELVANGAAGGAFNIAGGLHHAMPDRASGFCYVNDAAIAIKRLVQTGKRVAYIDIDAHHGDGVEYAFYDTDKVLTISLHESGQWLFPGTGFVTDMGMKDGTGYSVNMPLPPSAGDDLFVDAFDAVVPPFIEAFSPDIIVTQLGVDTFENDPITHLNLTTNGFETMVERMRAFKLPWVALGGGGYDLGNVARAWTIAWAVMNGVKAPSKIPKNFLAAHPGVFGSENLRDAHQEKVFITDEERARYEKDRDFLIKEVLPLVKKDS